MRCEARHAFYFFFRNEFNKFDNTGASMLYSIKQRTLKLPQTHIFGVENRDFAIFYATL